MAAVAAEQTAGSALERSLAESFRDSRSPRDPQWLIETRRAAMARLRETGFPTIREEDWKYTNVAPILKVPFAQAPEEGPRSVRPGQPPHPGPLPGGEG